MILRMQLDKTITCRNGWSVLFLINVHGPQRGTQSPDVSPRASECHPEPRCVTSRQPLHSPGCLAPFATCLSTRWRPEDPFGRFSCFRRIPMCAGVLLGDVHSSSLPGLAPGLHPSTACIATPASGTCLAVHCTLTDPNISSNRLWSLGSQSYNIYMSEKYLLAKRALGNRRWQLLLVQELYTHIQGTWAAWPMHTHRNKFRWRQINACRAWPHCTVYNEISWTH